MLDSVRTQLSLGLNNCYCTQLVLAALLIIKYVFFIKFFCISLNYAIVRFVTYQNYNNSKQYMYHQLPNFFCLKEINNSWLVYKNPILRHGDTQYYFTHVATLLRTILQHFSICFKAKKAQKFLKIDLFIFGTLYRRYKVTKEFAI